MPAEKLGKGGDEEVGAFVVEEARDYDYCDGVVGSDGSGGVRGWRQETGVGGLELREFGFVGAEGLEAGGDYGVRDYADGERIE